MFAPPTITVVESTAPATDGAVVSALDHDSLIGAMSPGTAAAYEPLVVGASPADATVEPAGDGDHASSAGGAGAAPSSSSTAAQLAQDGMALLAAVTPQGRAKKPRLASVAHV